MTESVINWPTGSGSERKIYGSTTLLLAAPTLNQVPEQRRGRSSKMREQRAVGLWLLPALPGTACPTPRRPLCTGTPPGQSTYKYIVSTGCWLPPPPLPLGAANAGGLHLNKKRMSSFTVLAVLFWGLKASPVVWTSSMEAKGKVNCNFWYKKTYIFQL